MLLNISNEKGPTGRQRRILHLRCDTCGAEIIKPFKSSIINGNHFCPGKKCYAQARRRGGISFEAARKTNLALYGTDHPMQNDEIKKKLEDTFEKRYGVKHNMNIPEVLSARQETLNQRYGGHQMKSSKVVKRFKATNMEKYGVETPLLIKSVLKKSHSREALDKKYETEKERGWHKTSRPEIQVADILFEMFGKKDVEHGVRRHGYCIDFYIKSLKVSLQLDGVYWHGLDRPIQEIKVSNVSRDIEIVKKYERDRLCDKLFEELDERLVRITDIEVNNTDDLKCLLKKRLGVVENG